MRFFCIPVSLKLTLNEAGNLEFTSSILNKLFNSDILAIFDHRRQTVQKKINKES